MRHFSGASSTALNSFESAVFSRDKLGAIYDKSSRRYSSWFQRCSIILHVLQYEKKNTYCLIKKTSTEISGAKMA